MNKTPYNLLLALTEGTSHAVHIPNLLSIFTKNGNTEKEVYIYISRQGVPKNVEGSLIGTKVNYVRVLKVWSVEDEKRSDTTYYFITHNAELSEVFAQKKNPLDRVKLLAELSTRG